MKLASNDRKIIEDIFLFFSFVPTPLTPAPAYAPKSGSRRISYGFTPITDTYIQIYKATIYKHCSLAKSSVPRRGV